MVGDDELMRAYVAGDAAAFEALYRRYDRRVYGFFLRAFADPALAEDLRRSRELTHPCSAEMTHRHP